MIVDIYCSPDNPRIIFLIRCLCKKRIYHLNFWWLTTHRSSITRKQRPVSRTDNLWNLNKKNHIIVLRCWTNLRGDCNEKTNFWKGQPSCQKQMRKELYPTAAMEGMSDWPGEPCDTSIPNIIVGTFETNGMFRDCSMANKEFKPPSYPDMGKILLS